MFNTRSLPFSPVLCLLALPLILLLGAGCATTPKPGIAARPEGTPALPGNAGLEERILSDLAANSAAIENFKASGKFVLKSPELDDVQILRQSSIRYRRPADLYVVGRKYSKAVFKLTCTQDGFLIVLPTEDSYYSSQSGARFRGISREVSPKDIANEMFFPEEWSKIKPETVLLADLAPEGGRAVLNIYESRRRTTLRRKVTVEGPPWHVVENARYDGNDAPIAVTTLGNFQQSDGLSYATNIESRFPSEDAYMQFDASTFEINAEQEAGDFDLKTQLHEVEQKGMKQIERK